MVLGNSNGQNTGKKYLKRSEIQRPCTTEERRKADDFNHWFLGNKEMLYRKMVSKSIWNEDIFCDTYIRICESLIYSETKIEDFTKFFFRSYFTNYILYKQKNNRYADLDATILHSLVDENDSSPEIKQQLIDKSLDFVRDNFSDSDYKIYKTYLFDLDIRNYANLSKMIGLSESNLQRTISKIKKHCKWSLGVNAYR